MTQHRIVFAPLPTLRMPHVSSDEAEGLVKLDGRDSSGNVKIWARHNTSQKFRQVGAMKYELADYFRKLMLNDDSERRRALREARHIEWRP